MIFTLLIFYLQGSDQIPGSVFFLLNFDIFTIFLLLCAAKHDFSPYFLYVRICLWKYSICLSRFFLKTASQRSRTRFAAVYIYVTKMSAVKRFCRQQKKGERAMSVKEEWRDIPGYDGRYQASNFGNIRSLNYRGKKRRNSSSGKKSGW